jgi:hypothetical protein
MDRDEAQQAQQEGRFVIASGVALLPVPLVWQFAGDSIQRLEWVPEIVLIGEIILIFALAFMIPRRTAPFAWYLLIFLAGTVPLVISFGIAGWRPNADVYGKSLWGVLGRAAGYSLPVYWVLLNVGWALVQPSMRLWHHVFFWSMAGLAWTYLAVPSSWQYFSANIGCCIVMIAVGLTGRWQSRRPTNVAT